MLIKKTHHSKSGCSWSFLFCRKEPSPRVAGQRQCIPNLSTRVRGTFYRKTNDSNTCKTQSKTFCSGELRFLQMTDQANLQAKSKQIS